METVFVSVRKKNTHEYDIYISNSFKGNIKTEYIVFNLHKFYFREATIDETRVLKFNEKHNSYVKKNGEVSQHRYGFCFTISTLEEIETGKYLIEKDGDKYYLVKEKL